MRWSGYVLTLVFIAATAAGDTIDRVLAAAVRDGRVDYTALAERRAELAAYLDALVAIDRASLDGDGAKAHDINLFNATMLVAVLDALDREPLWTPAADGFAVFKAPLVQLSDEKVSLNELETRMRRRYADPRIHAALNCAAASCPPLLPRTYAADDLNGVLDENMRQFVNDPTRNTIDHGGRRLVLSRIFDWYADDFGGRERIAAYVSRYIDRDVSAYAVSFHDYDWSLNAAR
jgi:hypothetical protein